MRYTTIFLVLMCATPAAHAIFAEKVIFLGLVLYDNDRVDLKSLFVEMGVATASEIQETGYRLVVHGRSGEVLYNISFYPGFDTLSLGAEEEVTHSPSVRVYLRAPYYPHASRLVIYHETDPIYSLDLKVLCNRNDRCDNNENGLSCPEDCKEKIEQPPCNPSPDGKCELRCLLSRDPDCAGPSKTAETSSTTPTPKTANTAERKEDQGMMQYSPYFAIIAAIFLAFILIHKMAGKKRIEKQREEFLRWKEEQEKSEQSTARP